MTNKSRIRIIKKRDVQTLKNETEVKSKPKKESTRRLFQTVSEWAREVQRKRQKECERAHNRFLVNHSPIRQV